MRSAKPEVAGAAADHSAKAAIAIIYVSIQSLTSRRHQDGLTIYAAAFAGIATTTAKGRDGFQCLQHGDGEQFDRHCPTENAPDAPDPIVDDLSA